MKNSLVIAQYIAIIYDLNEKLTFLEDNTKVVPFVFHSTMFDILRTHPPLDKVSRLYNAGV